MGVSANSKPPKLASRLHLKYIRIGQEGDGNQLDFPDPFSLLTRGFKFLDRLRMPMRPSWVALERRDPAAVSRFQR